MITLLLNKMIKLTCSSGKQEKLWVELELLNDQILHSEELYHLLSPSSQNSDLMQ